MRIGFVLFNWFPQGGMQQDLVKIVRACQGRANISIHCIDWEGEHLQGVATHVVNSRRMTKTATRAAFVDYVMKLVKPSVDLLVGFNRMPGLDYYFAADSCLLHRVREERPWWYRLTPRVRQYLQFEQAVFGRDSNTIALLLSRQQREQYLRHYHTSPARLLDLPPGIDRKHCAGPDVAALRASFRTEFNIQPHEQVVLQVGSSFVTKGVERSLRALTALPPAQRERVHYFLLGRDKRLQQWQQRATSTGLGPRLHFLDAGHSVVRCMQGADVLLHPSLWESAGMVILEAIVAGLPVLTTASCGYAQHVREADAGLVCAEPFVQDELNEKLATMLSADRSRWRDNGIRYGQTRSLYDMPAVVADILLKHLPAAATSPVSMPR